MYFILVGRVAKPPKNRWKWAKNDKNANFSKFPSCPIFKFFVMTREVICQILAPINRPGQFLWVLILLGDCSVPNSSDMPIFEKWRAEDGCFLNKNTGVRRAKRRAELKFLFLKKRVYATGDILTTKVSKSTYFLDESSSCRNCKASQSTSI